MTGNQGKKLCEKIIGKSNPIEFEGAYKLRDVVEWINDRPEILNFGKSHLQLIVEYNKKNK